MNQRMLGSNHHVCGPIEGIGASGIDSYGLLAKSSSIFARHLEIDFGACAFSNPIGLQLFDPCRPVKQIQIGEQTVCISGNSEHPLSKRNPLNRMIPSLAPTIDNLFICQHSAQCRTPIDQRVVLVSQTEAISVACHLLWPLGNNLLRDRHFADWTTFSRFGIVPSIKQNQKDPLGPAKVIDVGRCKASIPVVGEPQHLELTCEVGDVGFRALSRRCVGSNRVLLGRQTERVVAHWVQDRLTLHPPISAIDVRRGVALRVPNMQSSPARIRKHIQHVELSFAVRVRKLRTTKRLVLFPVGLPLGLDVSRIVSRHL